MNTVTQTQIRHAATAFKDGFKALSKFFPSCSAQQLDMIAGVLESDVDLAKPVASNTARIAGAKKQAPAKKGTVIDSITTVLKANGKPMNADAIVLALKEANALPPRAKDHKTAIAHVLATAKDHFTRVERGLYTVNTGKSVKQAKAEPKSPPKVDHTSAILAVLKKVKEPITIPDIAKAARLGEAFRSANTVMMTLGRLGIVSRLPEKSESKKALFNVDQKALAKYMSASN